MSDRQLPNEVVTREMLRGAILPFTQALIAREQPLNDGIEGLTRAIDSMCKALDAMNKRLDTILDQLNERFVVMDKQSADDNQYSGTIATVLNAHTDKLGQIEGRLASLESPGQPDEGSQA
jgi:hypothetical protein